MKSVSKGIKIISWKGQQWHAGQSGNCPYCPSEKPNKMVCWEHMYVYEAWLEGLRRAFGLKGAFRP